MSLDECAPRYSSDRRERQDVEAVPESDARRVPRVAASLALVDRAGYVQSMPKPRPTTPAPEAEKPEEFAHLAEGTLVSAPKKERVEARSRERARERSVSDD